MSEKITIYDIAEKLNITAATVSRALNNNPKIKESTRELVIKTAASMNYKQNKLALALKSGRSNNIGVIVPRIDSNFFASVIRGIEEELQPHGYQVIICQTHENPKRENENLYTLIDAQVDGIIMSVTDVTGENDGAFQYVLQNNCSGKKVYLHHLCDFLWIQFLEIIYFPQYSGVMYKNYFFISDIRKRDLFYWSGITQITLDGWITRMGDRVVPTDS